MPIQILVLFWSYTISRKSKLVCYASESNKLSCLSIHIQCDDTFYMITIPCKLKSMLTMGTHINLFGPKNISPKLSDQEKERPPPKRLVIAHAPMQTIINERAYGKWLPVNPRVYKVFALGIMIINVLMLLWQIHLVNKYSCMNSWKMEHGTSNYYVLYAKQANNTKLLLSKQ